MEKEIINTALKVFDTSEKWYAFVDLTERKEAIHNIWFNKVKVLMKTVFNSNEYWDIEFGNWWDVKWKLKSASQYPMQFWLSWDGNFHFLIINDSSKAEIIKNVFSQYKYDPVRYVWGTDVQTNATHEIKLKQHGKWFFNSIYDGEMKFDRLIWHAGNETEKFLDQVKEKVQSFQQQSIVQLLLQLQVEIEQAIAESVI